MTFDEAYRQLEDEFQEAGERRQQKSRQFEYLPAEYGTHCSCGLRSSRDGAFPRWMGKGQRGRPF